MGTLGDGVARLRSGFGSAVVAVAILATACGGDDDTTTTAVEDTPEVTLVDSGVRWIGVGPLVDGGDVDEVDVSILKSDPMVVGVETYWRYRLADPDDFTTIDATVVVELDGQRGSFAVPWLRGSNERLAEDGPLRIRPVGSEIEVSYRFAPRGVSDLFDADGNPVGLRSLNISLDFEAGSAGVGADFFEDVGNDGVLEYAVEVDVGLGGDRRLDTVTFRSTESDPSVAQVDDDPAALAAVDELDRQEAAEGLACEVDDFTLDDTTLTITAADGSVSLSATLPEGWAIEVDTLSNDPCSPLKVDIESPEIDGDDIGVSLLFRTPYFATLDEEVADTIKWDNTRYDDEGNEVAVEPGEDEYYEHVVSDASVWDRPARQLERANGGFSSFKTYVDAETRVIDMYWFQTPDPLVQQFLDSVELTTG